MFSVQETMTSTLVCMTNYFLIYVPFTQHRHSRGGRLLAVKVGANDAGDFPQPRHPEQLLGPARCGHAPPERVAAIVQSGATEAVDGLRGDRNALKVGHWDTSATSLRPV